MGCLPGCFESTGKWDHAPHITQTYSQAVNTVYMDMTQPLSHYFVSSGHNSYLSGNQLASKSGTKTIVKCLEAGCKVIELDVYNKQGSHGGPVCKHGGTMTKAVAVQDCIKAIKDHAFRASPYPVVITIENHTTGEQQKLLAEIIRNVLGDMLYVPDKSQTGKGWASPHELKNKVVVRTSIKPNTEPELRAITYIENTKFRGWEAMASSAETTSYSIGESKAQAFAEKVLPRCNTTSESSLLGAASGLTSSGSKSSPGKRPPSESKPKNKSKSGSGSGKERDLAAGGEDGEGGAPRGLEGEGSLEDDSDVTPPLMLTLEEVWEQSTRHLVRVYPAAWRVTSNNYDPTDAWNMGTSFAALNWQNWDIPLWVNQGKFMDNGSCGYVLKPEWMRKPELARQVWGGTPSQSADLTGVPVNRQPRRLRVHVHSAFKAQGLRMLWYRDDLFVQLEIRGMMCDKARRRTKWAQDSGHLTVEQDYDFDVYFPEMAVLIICIMDHDNGPVGSDYLGYYSLPLATLATGGFKLPMYKLNGKEHHHVEAWVKTTFSWVDVNPVGAQPLPAPPS